MKRFSNPERPWVLYFFNSALILLLIAMHLYLIAINNQLLNGSWLTYFLVIEIPISIFLVINIVFLVCFKYTSCQMMFLKLRYAFVDAFFIIDCAGLLAIVIVYIQAFNVLNDPNALTSQIQRSEQ